MFSGIKNADSKTFLQSDVLSSMKKLEWYQEIQACLAKNFSHMCS